MNNHGHLVGCLVLIVGRLVDRSVVMSPFYFCLRANITPLDSLGGPLLHLEISKQILETTLERKVRFTSVQGKQASSIFKE